MAKAKSISLVSGFAQLIIATLAPIALVALAQAQSGKETPCSAPVVRSESRCAFSKPPPSRDAAPDPIRRAPGANQLPSSPTSGVVNLNTATEQELVRLPGIGPARAKAILALRTRLGGRFKKTQELIRVRGIGRKTYRKLAPMLALQGPTTLTQPSRGKKR